LGGHYGEKEMNAARSVLLRHGLTLVVGASLFWLAFDGGTYPLTSQGAAAIVVWWVIALGVGLGFWPRSPVPIPALAAGGLLAAFAALAGLSALWADSEERSFQEFDRAVLYLGIFLLPVLAAPRGRTARRWVYGMGAAIVAIGVVALASRLFPQAFSNTVATDLPRLFPSAKERLSYPVNYWNGLASLLAFGLPFLLFSAVTARNALLRGLSLVPIPALVAGMYLTSSRGGALVGIVAVIVFAGLSGRVWRSAAATLVASTGAAAGIAVIHSRPAILHNVLATNSADGRDAAILIALACAVTGLAWGLLSLLPVRIPALPQAVRIATGVAAFAALALGFAAVKPAQRFESFKEVHPDLTGAGVQEHLLSSNGSGRWQLWESAVDEFRDAPLLGHGAGSYEAWWAQHGDLPLFVRDAHSLYLEVLAELGVVGLVFLLGFLALGFVTGLRRHAASRSDGRVLLAALTAVLVAYSLEAGIDWLWELPALSAVALVCLGLLTGPATSFKRLPAAETPERRTRRRSRIAIRATGVLAALALIVGQGIPFLAQIGIEKSRAAVLAGDADAALEYAQAATRVQPWAESPLLQLALVEEHAGDLDASLATILEACERASSDWRLWLVRARIETKAGRPRAAQRSLERAVALNPRSRLFRDL
jgi:O-antigen ligase